MLSDSTAVLRSELATRIQRRQLELPMLPQVTAQVLSLANDEQSDAAALARLIQSDQALAGHVMRIANSAAYSPSVKLASLQQAIARLGMQNITEIAMAASMGPTLFPMRGFGDLVTSMWYQALTTAAWSREIARQARKNVETAFLCGLLYRIGQPVVLQSLLKISGEQVLDQEVAQALMDEYQLPVGILLAEHWQLPAAVADTIRYIDAVSIGGSADTVETVRAGRLFAGFPVASLSEQREALITAPAIVALNLYPEDVDLLLARASQVAATVEGLSL